MRKIVSVSLIGVFVTVLVIIGVLQQADAQVFYGCYITKDGTGLRIVSDPTQCKKNETATSWYAKQDVDNLASQVANLQDALSETQSVVCDLAYLKNLQPFPSFCGPKLVFVSSAYSTGNLGGLAGADAECQSLADSAGLKGTFKAWLSDASASPSTRFTQWPLGYALVDGTVIATSWSDLTDGNLLNPINMTEAGGAPVGEWGPLRPLPLAWTGTTPAGLPSSFNCNSWTDEVGYPGGYSATPGKYSVTNSYWSQWDTKVYCHNLLHLYCFQQ